jgi:hypothetical protein
MEKQYKYLGYMSLLLLVLVIAGFYKSDYGLFPNFNSSITVPMHFHAFVMSLYVILLVMQPFLIFYKKFEAHRFLGKVSYVLVPVIIFSFLTMIHKEYNDKLLHQITKADFIEFTFLNIGKLSLFAAFYLLAIIHRKTTTLHMRYIIATALVFVEPSVARAAGFWMDVEFMPSILASFLITDLLLISLVFLDRKKQLNYKPYSVALTGFVLYQTIWYGFFYLI